MSKEKERIRKDINLTKAKHERTILVFSLITTVFVLWVLSWFLITTYIDKPEDRGTFGDMFGGVNALFSGMALAGIIYTIYVQKIELRLQRRELQMARVELHRQAVAQEQSGEALQEQVEAFKKISAFIELSITTTRNLNTSRAVSAALNSPEKIKLRKRFGESDDIHSISIDDLEKAFEKNPSVETDIEKLLGQYDEICLGIQQQVYEAEIIKGSCEQAIIDTFVLLKEYIHAVRQNGHPHAWAHLEEVVKQWQQEIEISDKELVSS